MTFPNHQVAAQSNATDSNSFSKFDQLHQLWADVLKDVVVIDQNDSLVNYTELKSHPTKLTQYLNTLSKLSYEQFSGFSKNQKLAFIINAYNSFTFLLIIQHYPVQSIRDIASPASPWKIKFVKLFGKLQSLDDIEHEMLAKWFDETRTHFALVCAAKSCPALKKTPYLADHLNQELDHRAKEFLLDPKKNYYSITDNTFFLSSIFDWYQQDFINKYGSVEKFVAPILIQGNSLPSQLSSKPSNIKYLNYDWSLNDFIAH